MKTLKEILIAAKSDCANADIVAQGSIADIDRVLGILDDIEKPARKVAIEVIEIWARKTGNRDINPGAFENLIDRIAEQLVTRDLVVRMTTVVKTDIYQDAADAIREQMSKPSTERVIGKSALLGKTYEGVLLRGDYRTRAAAAFNEWLRQYTEDPKAFMAQFECVRAFDADMAAGREPDHGDQCVDTLEEMDACLREKKPGADPSPPPPFKGRGELHTTGHAGDPNSIHSRLGQGPDGFPVGGE